jgi:hypothetical protein
MGINRKTLALMTGFILVLQVFVPSLCLADIYVQDARLTGKIYDRGVDFDHNGKFDFLEVSVETNVTISGDYTVGMYGLSDSSYNSISVYDTASAHLDVGVHLFNLSLNGPTIYISGRNPARVQYLWLYLVKYQLLTTQTLSIDSRNQVNLTSVYNFNEFDAPFKDMETRITVDPDGRVHLAGALNYTHMEPANNLLRTQGNARITTNGNLTAVSANATLTVSQETVSQFPFNSTSFSWLEEYSNRHYSMGTNATVVLPAGMASEFPFNVTDLASRSTYSNGLLTTELGINTALPEAFVSQPMVPNLPLLNLTDIEIHGQFLDKTLNGTITVHLLPGFPLGDLNIAFRGNKTDLHLEGSVLVMYNIPSYPLNETTLDQMLLYLNSTIPGHDPGSLYNITGGMLDCPYIYTQANSYDSIGAYVNFNASIHGNFMQTLFNMVLGGFLGSETPPELRSLLYSALNSTASSFRNASFQFSYTHISRGISVKLTFVDEFLNLIRDLSALIEEIPIFPPYPSYPLKQIAQVRASSPSITPSSSLLAPSISSMDMMSLSWIMSKLESLRLLNATLPYVEDATIELAYSSANKKFDLEATVQAEYPEHMPIAIPTELPPDIQQLMELLQNTTYCEWKSSKASVSYENGVATVEARYVAEGDLNAEINFVKNMFLTYMNKTSPLSDPLILLNETMIDISNLRINLDCDETHVTCHLEGLTVMPPRGFTNATSFNLERFFNITDELQMKSPTQRERFKIMVEGGSNVTHTIILHRPDTVPPPNETSPDMRTMAWYNQSLSSLKDLIFEIRPQSYNITVTTIDQSGNPVPSAIVTINWPNGTLWKTLSTDDYGYTSMSNVNYGYMPFGRYNITASYNEISQLRSFTLDYTGTYVITLPVSSPQIVFEITNPASVTSTHPVTGDAMQNAATVLTITHISDPVMIAVRNTTVPTGVPPPGTWKLLGNYVQIIANGTGLSVNGTIRMYYTHEQLAAAGVDEDSLKISYWSSSLNQWVFVQGQVNKAQNYVEAVVTHFSVWTIMGQPGAVPIWIQQWFWGIVIGMIILIAAAAAYVTLKKKPLKPATKSERKRTFSFFYQTLYVEKVENFLIG